LPPLGLRSRHTRACKFRRTAGGRDLLRDNLGSRRTDEALEVRTLRDREDGTWPYRTAKPCAPHDAAARSRARVWKARCNAGGRRSPLTRRRRMGNPLALSDKSDHMNSGKHGENLNSLGKRPIFGHYLLPRPALRRK